MSKYLCADCALREQCDSEWTMRCASYVPKEHKQTNEEYLKSCDTEQLAELLLRFYYQDYCMNTKRRVIEWLKQPHTFE